MEFIDIHIDAAMTFLGVADTHLSLGTPDVAARLVKRAQLAYETTYALLQGDLTGAEDRKRLCAKQAALDGAIQDFIARLQREPHDPRLDHNPVQT